MNTKTKVTILSTIAILFSWTWLLVGLMTIYFIATAIFFNGAWMPAIWAFLISTVSKWLAKGFEDNKNRVIYESNLIEQGHTVEEAGKKWVEEYTKK